jgi:hypothetical protein
MDDTIGNKAYTVAAMQVCFKGLSLAHRPQIVDVLAAVIADVNLHWGDERILANIEHLTVDLAMHRAGEAATRTPIRGRQQWRFECRVGLPLLCFIRQGVQPLTSLGTLPL